MTETPVPEAGGGPTPRGSWRVELLGPPRLALNGHGVPVPRGRVSALLAALALRVGTPVTRERLVDDLYGTDLPDNPEGALYIVVTRLRGVLGKHAVAHTGGAYLLEAADVRVDSDDFRRGVAEGRRLVDEGRPGEGVAELEGALRLWRGPALHGLAAYPFARDNAVRLDAERLAATERLMDLLLRVGRAGEAVPRLTALTQEQPDHEEFWRLLMTALYRRGRQGDALETFRTARHHLVNELGVEPGLALRTTHAEILHQQPWSPAGPAAPAAPTESESEDDGFVGRRGEARRLRRLLHRHRLVTVVGTGGTGKSRLAMRVVATVRRAGGVRVVELSSVQEGESLGHVVARQLGLGSDIGASVGAGSGRELSRRVLGYLRENAPLLVLDNCEHVIDAVAEFVAQVLRMAPEAAVFCTSRERLDLDDEQVLRLPPLAVPPAVLPPQGSLSDYESCRLFLMRARRTLPENALTSRDEAAILDICRRLDGIPLALELAAARVGVLSPRELARELRGRIDLLSRPRGDLPHHRTLRGAIDWSVRHLEPDAARTLLAVSVYPGGATLQALRHHLPELSTAQLVDALDQLVRKSLLVADTSSGSVSRYRELETVRSYGLEILSREGRLDRSLVQQLAWARRLVETNAPDLLGPELDRARSTLLEDHANLLRAVREGLRSGHLEDSYAVAIGLIWYWRMSGWGAQPLDILTQLGEAAELADQMRAEAHIWASHFAYARYDPERAAAHARLGLGLASQDASPAARRLRAFGMAFLGMAETRLGHRDAEGNLAAAVAAAEGSDDAHCHGVCLLAYSMALVESGRPDRAEALLSQAMTTFRSCGDSWHELRLLLRLLEVAESKGDLPRATELAVILTERAAATRLPTVSALGSAHHAWMAALSGDGEAEHLISRARALPVDRRDVETSAILDEAEAVSRARTGDVPGARAAIRRALEWYRTTGQSRRVVALLRLLGSVTTGPYVDRARAAIAADAVAHCAHVADPHTSAEALTLAVGVAASHDHEDATQLRLDTAAQLDTLAHLSGFWTDREEFETLRARWLGWLGSQAEGHCDDALLACRNRGHVHHWFDSGGRDNSSRITSIATDARGNPA